jgi:hypothetical protein
MGRAFGPEGRDLFSPYEIQGSFASLRMTGILWVCDGMHSFRREPQVGSDEQIRPLR